MTCVFNEATPTTVGTISPGGGDVHGGMAINVTPVPQKREGGGGVCVKYVFNEPTPTILGTISSGGGYVHGSIEIKYHPHAPEQQSIGGGYVHESNT